MLKVYSHNNPWLKAHQMSINGKNDNITVNDLLTVAENQDIKKSDAKDIIERTMAVNEKWFNYCNRAEVNKSNAERIFNIFAEKHL